MSENKTTILCPHCGKEISLEVKAKEDVVPTPEPTPEPSPEPSGDFLTFNELVEKFNDVLSRTSHNQMSFGMEVYDHLQWVYGFAEIEWQNKDSEFFNESYYPRLTVDARNDMLDTAYNAMQSWIFAMFLSRLCPTFGYKTNTQTELFKLAWELGGGSKVPLYGYAFKSNPYCTRMVAAKILSYTSGYELNEERISAFREELGGQMIPASCWDELCYENTMVKDSEGRRLGYYTKQVGFLVNTESFIPDAPKPRVEGTTVCELPQPWEEGQPSDQFVQGVGNYTMDEQVYNAVVYGFNMMAQTPIEEWNSYSIEKKNILINAAATVSCTYNYMFSNRRPVRLVLDENGDLPVVDGYRRFVFEECDESELAIIGAFPKLNGMVRYNACPNNMNAREQAVVNITDISDNGRFCTQDPNYGRSRPGCKPTLDGGERNPVHGSPENEIYNISIAAMVADNDEQKNKALQEDGWAADSPRSYVSGHSTQIMALALILGEMNPDEIHDYMASAYAYSNNRAIARYHWNSDCIYGRLFGTIVTPIIQAMDGMQDGLKAIKEFVDNPTPQQQGDYPCTIIIKNETDEAIGSTGEIRLYVRDHIGINAYLPNWVQSGRAYTFNVGESSYNTNLLVNGDDVPPADFEGDTINEVRFYDYRHWNNIDAGFNAVLDTDDPRCTPDITSGGVYVIRITKI